jgi:two-component system, NtrC family, response regulator GlrR
MGHALKDKKYDPQPDARPGRRILVADDDPDALEGLQSLLELWGYQVETASDGRAALDRMPKILPSLVITDVVMPRMSGLELLEAIRRELPTLPVIVMTAHGTLETWRRATSQGAFAYLPKPLDATRLKTLLAWAFEGGHGDARG